MPAGSAELRGRHRRADGGAHTGRIGCPAHIGDIPLACCAHRRYLERWGTLHSLDDLKAHRLIGVDRQTAYVRMMMKRFPIAESIEFSFRTDSNLAQLAALFEPGSASAFASQASVMVTQI